ncbi:MAG: hypothetical protein ACRCYM_02975 [Cetobacterium sp.]
MKKLFLLFSLITLIGCSQFSNRKDHSQKISFQKNIPEGKYNFKIISFDYPDNYNDKIDFYNNLNENLTKLNDIQKNSLNLLINSEFEKELISLLKNGWIDKEILGMKIVEDLNNDEISILNNLSISTPTEAGENQKLLNKQYFILLQLTQNENMYNSEFLYTELDKSLLMEDVLLNRQSIINNLNKIKQNFVYSENNDSEDRVIFIKNNNINLNSLKNKTVFIESNSQSGFKVLENSLTLFVGNSENVLFNDDYNFTSNLVKLNSFDELKEAIKNSSPISDLNTWKRNELKKNVEVKPLSNKFSDWEVK